MAHDQSNLSVERTCAEIARLHALNESEAELACALACMFDDPNDGARTGICVHRPDSPNGANICTGKLYRGRRFDHSFGFLRRARGSDATGPSHCPSLLDAEIRRSAIHASRMRD